MWLEMPTGEMLNAAVTWKDKVWNWFTDMDMWQGVLISALKILLIFILTRLFVKVIYRLIDRSLERRKRTGCK